MTYNTPYQQKLQADTYHDSDETAAGWRLFASQIQDVYKDAWEDLQNLATTLEGHYKSYLKTSAEEKSQRFSLKLTISSKLDPSGLLNYHANLRDQKNVNLFRTWTIILTHLESTFGVSVDTLAGIMGGVLALQSGVHEMVAQEICVQIGGSNIITDIPGAPLAGQYQPTYFPKSKTNGGSNYQMAFRRRY